MTRATIRTPIDVASAASSEPTARAASVTTKTRFLPNMSPTRPRIGVMIDADSRYAVSTQVAAVLRGVQFVLHRRQDRDDQRLQQGEGGHARRQHSERHLIMRPLATGRHPGPPEAELGFRYDPSKAESRFRVFCSGKALAGSAR